MSLAVVVLLRLLLGAGLRLYCIAWLEITIAPIGLYLLYLHMHSVDRLALSGRFHRLHQAFINFHVRIGARVLSLPQHLDALESGIMSGRLH